MSLNKDFIARVGIAVSAAVLFLSFAFYSDLNYLFVSGFFVLAALREYFALVQKGGYRPMPALSLGIVAIFFFIAYTVPHNDLSTLHIALVLCMAAMVMLKGADVALQPGRGVPPAVFASMFGALYIGGSISCTINLVHIQHQIFPGANMAQAPLVLLPFVGAWASDTGAYLSGRIVGREKLSSISLVDETIKEPCADSIGGAVATMEIVFEEFVKNRSVIDRLVRVVATDYTTAAHSVNVMALVLRFCSFCGMKGPAARRLGLAALLHDVGKVKVHKRLLQAPRRLTEAEFEAMKKHTVYGHDILRAAGMEQDVCLVALNHHERVDGSGYPNGITEISEEAQIIAFIDCYEALTCNTRPYRDAVCPFEALSHIRHELFRGNFGTVVFEKFVKSLG